jgi:hypothetical protein
MQKFEVESYRKYSVGDSGVGEEENTMYEV